MVSLRSQNTDLVTTGLFDPAQYSHLSKHLYLRSLPDFTESYFSR